MRLPSERALAAQLNVSRVTVVRALTRLRLEGLLVTRHGAGTSVAATDRLMDTVAARSAGAWQPPAAHAEAAIDLRWATTAGPAELLKIATAAVEHGLPAALALDGTVADSGDELKSSLAEYLSATCAARILDWEGYLHCCRHGGRSGGWLAGCCSRSFTS